jgi:hypothetical protein
MKFVAAYVGKFDRYVEDEYATFVRDCFEDLLDAAIFRWHFEVKVERLKLAQARARFVVTRRLVDWITGVVRSGCRIAVNSEENHHVPRSACR